MSLEGDRNTYWSPVEWELGGALAHSLFARVAGCDPVHSLGTGHGPDVAGCEVKAIPWRDPRYMDDWEGGRVFVPLHTRARVIVAVTVFTSSWRDGGYYEGWIARDAALRYPQAVNRYRRAAVAVPYCALSGPLVPLPHVHLNVHSAGA